MLSLKPATVHVVSDTAEKIKTFHMVRKSGTATKGDSGSTLHDTSPVPWCPVGDLTSDQSYGKSSTVHYPRRWLLVSFFSCLFLYSTKLQFTLLFFHCRSLSIQKSGGQLTEETWVYLLPIINKRVKHSFFLLYKKRSSKPCRALVITSAFIHIWNGLHRRSSRIVNY